MLGDTAETWVTAFAERWNASRGAVSVEDFLAILDPDVRLIQPLFPTTVGHEEYRNRLARPLLTLIPDLHGEVERETYLDPLPLLRAFLTRPRAWPAAARALPALLRR